MTNVAENNIVTPEQRRAKAAWQATEKMSGQAAKDFASQCKQTSARILNSGIMPALAFLDAKVKDKDTEKTGPAGKMKECMDALVTWLSQFVKGSGSSDVKQLLKCLMDSAPAVLRRAQSEALAYLEWLARFAEGRAGELKPKEGGTE